MLDRDIFVWAVVVGGGEDTEWLNPLLCGFGLQQKAAQAFLIGVGECGWDTERHNNKKKVVLGVSPMWSELG